jgi:hypothetical protein
VCDKSVSQAKSLSNASTQNQQQLHDSNHDLVSTDLFSGRFQGMILGLPIVKKLMSQQKGANPKITHPCILNKPKA